MKTTGLTTGLTTYEVVAVVDHGATLDEQADDLRRIRTRVEADAVESSGLDLVGPCVHRVDDFRPLQQGLDDGKAPRVARHVQRRLALRFATIVSDGFQ